MFIPESGIPDPEYVPPVKVLTPLQEREGTLDELQRELDMQAGIVNRDNKVR